MDSDRRSAQLERLEVVDTGRRRRWSEDEKLKIVLESLQAPPQVAATARRYGVSPVNALQQVAKLGWGDCHHAISRRRPQKAAALQSLGIERHAQPIMPEDLDELAALATEHVEVAAVRVAPKGFLHQHGQRVHARGAYRCGRSQSTPARP